MSTTKIDAYSFGSMKINGKVYQKDLVLFPDRVIENWWRASGHSLTIEDLKEVVDYKPEILVIGLGAMGVMNIPEDTKESLKKHDIALTGQKTGEAVDTYNKYMGEGKRVVGAFHLTC